MIYIITIIKNGNILITLRFVLILSASINTDHLEPLNATPLLLIRTHPPLRKLLLRHTYKCRPVRHEQIRSTLVLLIGGSIVEELDLCIQLCSRLLVKNTLEKVYNRLY